MRIPTLTGRIRRRLLINYRADPEVVGRLLPSGFHPVLHAGHAVVGICLIRLEQIRPRGLPSWLGIASENAAHRIAVDWDASPQDGKPPAARRGVFVLRRDTDDWRNQLAGGRLFPGRQHRARFCVADKAGPVTLSVRSHDQQVAIDLSGTPTQNWPADSIFCNCDEAAAFFEQGSLGYSPTPDPSRFDGIILHTNQWRAAPFEIANAASSYFDNVNRFPAGSIQFDHALIMRDLEHHWHRAPTLRVKRHSTVLC